MLKRWTAASPCTSCLSAMILILALPRCMLSTDADKNMVSKEEYYSATVNATVLDLKGNPKQMLTKDDGRYGQNSPKTEAKGIVVTPAPVNGGTGDTVAVMITESYGKELLGLLDRNLTVLVSVTVGSRGPPRAINRGSLVFVSISFIVLMIISSAWLIFFFIQKIRNTNARDRSQRRLGDAAKKAIGKLTTRTVKRGDKETDPDFNHCAVCIEGYQLNDVVRILPCKHVFHKMCVDPWLNEHCTCPMCKLNILKALGIMPNLPCMDNAAFDMDRISHSQTSSQRTALVDLSSETSISVEPLRSSGTTQIPSDIELTPRTGEINIAVTKEWFIIGSFGLLSALTLCYMIIKATAVYPSAE
uniref:RING-type domain-containing protein n=1 Tax=Denticeps clupeoides TaxID=299321 RepID=A0AAY4CCL5_9TELE